MQLVSILIPVYNAEAFVAEAIQSALNQTWPAKEIVVVDDGSSDQSREILQGFESAGIKLIEQENRAAPAPPTPPSTQPRENKVQNPMPDNLLRPKKMPTQIRRRSFDPQPPAPSVPWDDSTICRRKRCSLLNRYGRIR